MSDANSKKYRKTVQSENENIIINTTQKISKHKKELASLHYVTIMDDKNKKVQDYLPRMEIPIELLEVSGDWMKPQWEEQNFK